ncbi:MAG: hypothetical protein S4CHLAM102_11530 [Chlamydiia bacterium]|nr:hypothetical protein [Chlamydiia bacterium]
MKEDYKIAQQPLILRFHRLIEAFSKSDDERDFYLDKVEGFLLFLNLDKHQDELEEVEAEIKAHPDRYCLIPKLSFYETKKFMEGFVHEKVYDIDTKEKLLDIIGGQESRENFLEFIYDHLHELEKWQQYYNERSRIRIIEWLREHDFTFVFEEDMDLPKPVVEKLKVSVFDAKVAKDVQSGRNSMVSKSKTYYSNEALNPRPKRGRPPKQNPKTETVVEFTTDLYQTVPKCARHFLFVPDFKAHAVTFSRKFETEEQFLAGLKGTTKVKVDSKLEALSQRLESLRHLSSKLRGVVPEDQLGGLGAAGSGEEGLAGKVGVGTPADGLSKMTGLAQGFLPSGESAPPEEKKRRRKSVTSMQTKKPKKK